MKEQILKQFEKEFQEYAHENENDLLDSDTTGESLKKFISQALDKYAKREIERLESKFRLITNWKYHCVGCGKLFEYHYFIDTDKATEDEHGNPQEFCICE